MYTANICLNPVSGGPIDFILGGGHKDEPQRVRHKMGA